MEHLYYVEIENIYDGITSDICREPPVLQTLI